ncbi:MAG: fluoride efflux transporter CrcB [Alistipes sp.]|nr:fluoride efflux transporter CrcB [Alistipes sp.]
MIKTMLIAGLGGFVGTCMRFLTGKLCNLLVVGTFPLGTFAVNIVGSFIIGLLFGAAERTHAITPAMSALLITGFCGGFTTFSTFADDIYLLLQNRHYLTLAIYAGGTIVLGIALVWAGRTLMKG